MFRGGEGNKVPIGLGLPRTVTGTFRWLLLGQKPTLKEGL